MKKILACALALVMMCAMVPLSVFAATPTEVSDSIELAAALSAGASEITLTADITLRQMLEITADTTINMGSYDIRNEEQWWSDASQDFDEYDGKALFSVTGATLTLNGNIDDPYANRLLCYTGGGSAIALTGAVGKATGVVLNGVAMTVYGRYIPSLVPEQAVSITPDAAVTSTVPAGAQTPTVTILKGGASVQKSELESNNGPLVSGDVDVTIHHGNYYTDITAWVPSTSFAYTTDWGEEQWWVLSLSATMSDAFKAHLNANGEMELKYFVPSEERKDSFFNWMYGHFNPYDLDGNPTTDGDAYIVPIAESYDFDKQIMGFEMYSYETGEMLERHLVKLAFMAGGDRVKEVADMIASFPQAGDGEDVYFFSVRDLELFSYWLFAPTDFDSQVDSFVNYSDEFKKLIGYQNYSMDVGAGMNAPFDTETMGEANFEYDGMVYGNTTVGVKAVHELFVADGTADDALMAAGQARLDAFFGKDALKIQQATVEEAVLWSYYQRDKEMWSWDNPDTPFVSFEEYCAPGPYRPTLGAVEEEALRENVEFTTVCYKVEVNGDCHYFFITADTAKMFTPPYQTVDVETKASVTANDGTIPLDTLISIDTLTSGEEYERIIKALDPESSVTFDITLHSARADKYVTKLENGKFQVKLPVPAEFEGKELKVWYVDANGNTTEHACTVQNGFVIFETDHFSAYTITAAAKAGSGTETVNPLKPVKPAPTGDGFSPVWFIVLAAISLATIVGVSVYTKRKAAK